jgi:hypothetical protein
MARCRDTPFVIESRYGGPRDRSRFTPGADCMDPLIKIVTARTTKFPVVGWDYRPWPAGHKADWSPLGPRNANGEHGDRSVLERIDGAIFDMAHVISFIADQMLCRKKPRILIGPPPISLKRTATRHASIL